MSELRKNSRTYSFADAAQGGDCVARVRASKPPPIPSLSHWPPHMQVQRVTPKKYGNKTGGVPTAHDHDTTVQRLGGRQSIKDSEQVISLVC